MHENKIEDKSGNNCPEGHAWMMWNEPVLVPFYDEDGNNSRPRFVQTRTCSICGLAIERVVPTVGY